MHLLSPRPTGPNSQPTPTRLLAQPAKLRQSKRIKFGLIVDRLYSQKNIGENGKNFISVNVERLGGRGVAIVPPQS